MFALVDCNNFYASCERVFNPGLRDKPIVVLSNNDGCVIARSNEAKDLGIPMGAPAFQYSELFRRNNVHVFSANFQLYGDMSNRVMTILSDYCPDMEIYSIDESFLDFSGFGLFDLQKYGEEMARKVHKSTGIPVSVGIASTKALAKLANRIAKKYPTQTKGTYIIDTEEKRIKALKWLKVEDIWGIGRKLSKRLQARQVFTAYEFTQLPDIFFKHNLSIVEFRLKQDLAGIPTLDLETIQTKKSIATTRTFERDYTTLEELKERIVTFTVANAEKLRKQNSCCNSMMIFLLTNRFKEDLPQTSANIVVKLPYATNSSMELTQFALQGLSKIFKEGYSYKKAGVMVMDFCKDTEIQRTLFENSNEKHKPLMEAIDKLNDKIGQQKIRLAAQDPNRIWKMRQEKLSPRYSTVLSEIITVNCT